MANLRAASDIELRYVCDPALEHDAVLLNAILADDEVDACVIATPSSTHVELVVACARAGKHVFCEKPISFDVKTLQEVKRIVQEANVLLQVGFNRRFDPSFHAVQRECAQGKIGEPHLIKIINRDPERPRSDFVKNSGGLFFDFNVHDFDMLRFVTGDEVVEVFAVGDALIDPVLRDFNDIDTAIITARMDSGALATIDTSRESGYGYDQQLELLGSRGALKINNRSKTSVSIRNAQGNLQDSIYDNFQQRFHDSYRIELASFFASLASHTVTPTIDDAIAAVKIACAATQSLQEKRPVAIME